MKNLETALGVQVSAFLEGVAAPHRVLYDNTLVLCDFVTLSFCHYYSPHHSRSSLFFEYMCNLSASVFHHTPPIVSGLAD